MIALKPAVLLLSVALFAALIGHVVIDVLGDFMLAHDAYDDIVIIRRVGLSRRLPWDWPSRV